MAPPTTTAVSPVVALLVRLLAFICLLIALILLGTNTATLELDFEEAKVKFNDLHAYRYMFASIVLGIAYTLLQIILTIFQVSTGNRLGGDRLYQFDFYADKLISYIVATGAAAGYGLTIDLKTDGDYSVLSHFLNRALAASSLCFIGFLFIAISSIFSSLAFPKRV